MADRRADGSAPSLPTGDKLEQKKPCVGALLSYSNVKLLTVSFSRVCALALLFIQAVCALPWCCGVRRFACLCIQPSREQHSWDFLLMIHLSVYLSFLSPPTSTMDSAVKGNVCISDEGMAGN